MEKKLLQLLLVIGLIFSGSTASFAQRNFGFYNGFQNLPQSHYYNPSWNAKNNVYFSIGTGLHSLGASNSGFALKDILVDRSQDDSLEIDIAGALNKMANLNYLGATIQNELFGLGIKLKKHYISFGIVNRLDFHLAYPKDFIQLIFEGNGGAFLGQRANMDGLGFNMNSYVEYGIGINREIGSKLKIGARVKLLSGVANVKTKKSALGLTTDATTFDLTLDGELDLRTSGIPDSDSTFDQKGAYNFKNRGLAFDFGFTFEATEKLKLTGSLLDLGSIRWKQNVQNFERKAFSYNFQGVDINQALQDSNYLETFQDTLKEIFLVDGNNASYRAALPMRVILGATYDLNKLFGVGAVWFSDFTNKKYRPTLMLTGSLHVKNWLFVNVNYSISSRSAKNLGVGLGLKGLGMSYFITTDNLLGFMNPAGARNFHVSTGLGFCIGRTDREKEIDN
jgi:hypothetical protein